MLHYYGIRHINEGMPSPLSPPAFWTLTVLATGRRHGYEIMREIAALSGGSVVVKATTLYAALDRLERDGLIVADGEEVVNGRARRYYRIAEDGTARLAIEAELLERSARAARSRLVAGPGVGPVRPAAV